MYELIQRKGYKATSNIYKKLPRVAKEDKGYNYILRLHKNGETIIKIGTTNNMKRRLYEHLGQYKANISVLWISPEYSKYTTLKVEDDNKKMYKKRKNWRYIRNDRFAIPENTTEIVVTVRKEYRIKIE